jgi:hypothetical protein
LQVVDQQEPKKVPKPNGISKKKAEHVSDGKEAPKIKAAPKKAAKKGPKSQKDQVAGPNVGEAAGNNSSLSEGIEDCE